MTGKIERIDGGILSQRIDIEEPIVEIAAEAVDQNDTVIARSTLGVANAAIGQIDELVFRPCLAFPALLGNRRHIGGDIVIDLLLGDALIRNDPEERLHRVNDAGLADPPAQRAGIARLDAAGDLIRLDFEDRLADIDTPARLDEPTGELALLHRQAPFGHDDRNDALLRHRMRLSEPQCA